MYTPVAAVTTPVTAPISGHENVLQTSESGF